MSDVLCGAPSLWPGITCQASPHDEDRHTAEDERSVYTWSTAAVEADQRGDCPGCRQRVCTCRVLRCACGCPL